MTEFIRRKSYFLSCDKKEDLDILHNGQHKIVLYNRNTVVGTYLTSMRETNEWGCLYLEKVPRPKEEDLYTYNEFHCGFDRFGGKDHRMWSHSFNGMREVIFDEYTMKLKTPDRRTQKRISRV